MNALNTLWLGTRAAIFWVGFAISTLLAGLLTPVAWLFPLKYHYPAATLWNCFNLWWLKVTCGVKYHIIGRENIPTDSAFIIMSNHQSTWETLAIPCIFPQQLSWVMKRELLKIPFFGWGLRLIRPIAIDRNAGKAAVKQISQQGKALLQEGISIVIFPEGTRVAPDTTVPFKIGGAILASHSGFPVVPVAHNAGLSWRRHAWIKKPGTITISIGPAFATQKLKTDAINQQAQHWIETEKQRLAPP
ncbi:MAG: lysophospholipid acyltransferase family protein [Candidatus Thiothrix putei]|uniref:1-acyl-sn-glycerol-3-phosphate acyltransferase n=1 Tax=Candidatus Thiothrix putei TaxID=3080811 RepID=A0AA95KM09_9GAMM|nr:MAG: lysophospholipid acyltransferase family protein [Candidatus Thiothrix putei]